MRIGFSLIAFSLIFFDLSGQYSVARKWNEVLLEGIRNDYARPTVHARNLFHVSAAMYDSWAAYDENAETYFLGKTNHGFTIDFSGMPTSNDIQSAREETMSYACYRLLYHRFQESPDFTGTRHMLDSLFTILGYDASITSTDYASGSPAALGNHIAQGIIDFGMQDGSTERFGYINIFYYPVNPPLNPKTSGSQELSDPNRWQPLAFDTFIDQSGNEIPAGVPEFLSPEWGFAAPFSLSETFLEVHQKEGNEYWVYHDPGSPALLDQSDDDMSQHYIWNHSMVVQWASHLDPTDGVIWDISPGSIGNLDIDEFPTDLQGLKSFYDELNGGDHSTGWDVNPTTGEPYDPQLVPRGDYARVLAEFWADGPDSETPPGHWFTILNYVSDQPEVQKRFTGQGEPLSALEWDVKSYFLLGGAMHDAAIAAWSIKGYYDYIRPISAIRSMAERGQSSDPGLDNYDPWGIRLIDGVIELVDAGDELEGTDGEHIGKIKVYTWKGPDYITDEETDVAGVGWILAENWWPYQRPTFVTPPFAGYVSGHSTFSRAAAEILTALTGDEFFPGGMGEFVAKKNEFLVFEDGPSQDVILQWATYRDASDQCSLSRIWGGIHPPVDDIPGRLIGEKVGKAAFEKGSSYFGTILGIPKGNGGNLVFPNPVEKGAELVINSSYRYDSYAIHLLSGKRLVERKIPDTNRITIEVDPGIHFLILKNSNTSSVQKIVVK